MTARKMTGIGFYGQPHQITKMLAKVLVRFERLPLDIQAVEWRGDARAAKNGCRTYAGQRQILDARQARAAMPCEAELTGFFLAMSEGRAELHIRLRGFHKGGAQSRGR